LLGIGRVGMPRALLKKRNPQESSLKSSICLLEYRIERVRESGDPLICRNDRWGLQLARMETPATPTDCMLGRNRNPSGSEEAAPRCDDIHPFDPQPLPVANAW